MSHPLLGIFGVLLLISTSAAVEAEEICDCAVKVGNCNARLAVKPASQANGIHGALVKVITDSASCSRVDYYVEHTPTVLLLRHGGSAEEKITGSLRPMTAEMFTVDACRICEVRQVPPSSGQDSLAESLFGEAISSGESFDPNQKARRISELEAQKIGGVDAQAVEGVLNTVQKLQQRQQRPGADSPYESGLQNHNPGVGYEYGDSSVRPLPPSSQISK